MFTTGRTSHIPSQRGRGPAHQLPSRRSARESRNTAKHALPYSQHVWISYGARTAAQSPVVFVYVPPFLFPGSGIIAKERSNESVCSSGVRKKSENDPPPPPAAPLDDAAAHTPRMPAARHRARPQRKVAGCDTAISP
eukprot:gene9887-biopygen22763